MSTLYNLATSYVSPDPGCEYTEWAGTPGLEYPTKQECGSSRSVMKPTFYIPATLALVIVIFVTWKLLKRRSVKK